MNDMNDGIVETVTRQRPCLFPKKNGEPCGSFALEGKDYCIAHGGESCGAAKANGEPCERKLLLESGLCPWHDPDYQEARRIKKSRLQRKTSAKKGKRNLPPSQVRTPVDEAPMGTSRSYVLVLPSESKLEIDCRSLIERNTLERFLTGFIQQHETVGFSEIDWHMVYDSLLTRRDQFRAEEDDTELSITDRQRMAATIRLPYTVLGLERGKSGVQESLDSVLKDYRDQALRFVEETQDSLDWSATCGRCGATTMHRQDIPHKYYHPDRKTAVWCPELMPLVRRFYDAAYRKETSGKMAGMLSVSDVAKIWGMTPLGVLWTIWKHAAEGAGAQDGEIWLTPMKELCGFEFNFDKPDTLRPYCQNFDEDIQTIEKELAEIRHAAKEYL